MSSKQTGSGGKVEQTIWFLAGCLMGLIGVAMGYLCYKWAITPKYMEMRWAWVAGTGGLAMFLLRGAYYTIIPEKVEDVRFKTRGD